MLRTQAIERSATRKSYGGMASDVWSSSWRHAPTSQAATKTRDYSEDSKENEGDGIRTSHLLRTSCEWITRGKII